MAAFDFPASPSTGQVFTAGGKTYQWDGEKWQMRASAALYPVKTANTNNLLTNGAFQFAQEFVFGTNITVSDAYVADQWQCGFAGLTGNTNVVYLSYNAASTVRYGWVRAAGTATPYTSIAANNFSVIYQRVEGLAIAELGWTNPATAIPAVLDFEAQSSVAGTFSCYFKNGGATHSIVFPVTFEAGDLNKWKRFTFAIPAPLVGTWVQDVTLGAYLGFSQMVGTTYGSSTANAWVAGNYHGLAGQTNLFATASNIIYYRNVGLYADPDATGVAPKFQVPAYATEMARCKRYWQQVVVMFSGYAIASNAGHGIANYPVQPRGTPTLSGVHYQSSNYPTTVGPITNMYNLMTYEYRVATATATGWFQTLITVNARM